MVNSCNIKTEKVRMAWTLIKGFALLIILRVVESELCASNFKAKYACETQYGIELMVITGIRNKIECATHCEKATTCMSFTYKTSTQTCRTNAQIQSSVPVPCGNDVVYSEPKLRGCTFSSQISLADTDPVTQAPTTTTTTIPPPTTTTTTTTIPPPTTTAAPNWQGSLCGPGYRYDYTKSLCAEDCNQFTDSFQYTPDYILVLTSTVYKQVSGMSDPAVCRQNCLNEVDFVCKTFEINGDLGNCYWSDTAVLHVPTSDFYAKTNFFLWHRDCA